MSLLAMQEVEGDFIEASIHLTKAIVDVLVGNAGSWEVFIEASIHLTNTIVDVLVGNAGSWEVLPQCSSYPGFEISVFVWSWGNLPSWICWPANNLASLLKELPANPPFSFTLLDSSYMIYYPPKKQEQKFQFSLESFIQKTSFILRYQLRALAGQQQ